MHTITHQSVLLGVPAMQIEFPRSLRSMIMSDPHYITSLARAILSVYKEVIVP
jgi:hypothetical protein